MLAQHEILESLTTAAHGEISTEVLEAAATKIWENNDFESLVDFEAYTDTWEIVAKHDITQGARLVVGPTDQLTENPPTT